LSNSQNAFGNFTNLNLLKCMLDEKILIEKILFLHIVFANRPLDIKETITMYGCFHKIKSIPRKSLLCKKSWQTVLVSKTFALEKQLDRTKLTTTAAA
jgi:hypothetical protein